MGKKVMTKVEKSIHEESEKISEARRAIKAQKNIIDNSDIIPEELDDKDWREKEFSFPNNTVRIGTVFSGIGAIEHAFQRLKLKHKIIFAGDIDANCKKSYFANYEINEEDWFTDVREFDASKYRGKVDFVIGGAPCQAFSMVGKRLGFEDARGTLFYEFARIVKETNPKVFLFENVKGMLNHDGGRTWRVIHDIFEELGYDVHFRVLNSKDYKIKEAYSDLEKKLTTKEKNNPWENAYNHAAHIAVAAEKTIIEKLKKLSNDYTKNIHLPLTDFNLMPCGTVFDHDASTDVIKNTIFEQVKTAIDSMKYKKLCVIAISNRSYNAFLKFIGLEA